MKNARRILLFFWVVGLLIHTLPVGRGQELDEIGYVNPFTGDKSRMHFNGLERYGGSVYASFTVRGFADMASGRHGRDFSVLVKVEMEGDGGDLTSAVAEAIAAQMRSSAVHVKENLQSLYLWTDEDKERILALDEFLSVALDSFKARDVADAAYMMREALRLLLTLEGHLSMETQISYLQGPITLFMLALFSFFLARLLSTRLWKSLTVLIFTVMMLVFAGSHPYIRIFFAQVYSFVCTLTEYPRVLERPDLLILNVMLLVSPFFVLLVVLRTWRPSDHSVLEQTVGGMKARRVRFVLALTTIIIVSAAAMAHSAAFISPMATTKDLPQNSAVTYGLVAFKYTLNYFTPEEPRGGIVPIQRAEALWFSERFSRESSMYGMRKVLVGNATSTYGEFKLATMNLTYAQEYSGFTVFFDASPEPESSGNWVIASQEFLRSLGIGVGDDVFVEGRPLKVVGTYSGEDGRKLVDIDGYPLFTRVEDGRPQPGLGEAVDLVTNYDVFNFISSEFTKVSMVLDAQQPTALERSVQGLLTIETDIYEKYIQHVSYGPVVFHVTGFTYLLHVVEEGAVKEALPVGRTVQVQGSWVAQAVVIAIGAGIMYVTATAIVYEKRKDFKVMSIVGAKPSFITLSLLSEGLLLGVIGGVLSYGLGYVTIWGVNLLFPNNVVALPSGLFHMILVTTISVFTSIAGYLMPARDAIRLVIPSGLLRREVGEVISQDRAKMTLHTPLRVHIREKPLLEAYFLRKFPASFQAFSEGRHGLTVKGVTAKEDLHCIAFVYEAFYTPVSTSRQPIPVLLTVRADKHADHLILETRVESNMLRRFSKLDLKEVLLEVRENILGYVDWKTRTPSLDERHASSSATWTVVEPSTADLQSLLDSLIENLRQNFHRALEAQEVPLDQARPSESPGVYMLFFEGKLQYIGFSGNLAEGIRRDLLNDDRKPHTLIDKLCALRGLAVTNVAGWLEQNSKIKLIPTETEDDAKILEGFLIAIYRPDLNTCPRG